MRAQSRLALAPEAGGGRVTEVRTAPKLSGMQIAPEATAVSHADYHQCHSLGTRVSLRLRMARCELACLKTICSLKGKY
eukprot:5311490-Pleurochrysis_carterae.AAC.1